MFSSSPKDAIKAYSKVSIETGLLAANPHQLIVLLFDSAIKALTEASEQMTAKNTPEKGRLITHAILIIESGLRASLNKKVGGQLAITLDELYAFLSKELIYANLDDDQKKLASVKKSLTELRSAWLKIAPASPTLDEDQENLVQANLNSPVDPLAPKKNTTSHFSA